VRVHRAKGGETLEALDEKTYTFAPGTRDFRRQGVESIAGIMGGEASGCTEETVNVFLESAYWDPIHTAYTGRDLKINSDARYRFERGVDPGLHPAGAGGRDGHGAGAVRRRGVRGRGGRRAAENRARLPLDTAGASASSGMEIPESSRCAS
jgi:phenylalanyl-tRNA synthetase beta chain